MGTRHETGNPGRDICVFLSILQTFPLPDQGDYGDVSNSKDEGFIDSPSTYIFLVRNLSLGLV